MDKEFILSLSKKVMSIAQKNGIAPRQLKTYTGILVVATGVMTSAIFSPTEHDSRLNTSPYKPAVIQSSSLNASSAPMNLEDMKLFLDGNGDAKVYKNPYADNESITLVHADKYKTLASLQDPERWAAQVAIAEGLNPNSASYTYCNNQIDWEQPIVSLSGKCLAVLNINNADKLHSALPTKSKVTQDDVRLFVLLHEAAHGQSTSRALSALHKSTETDAFRENFSEKQADVAAFIALSNAMSPQRLNQLFDAVIQMRSFDSSSRDASHNTHGLLVLAQKMFNEKPDFFKNTPKEDILFKATIMTKAYNDTLNKEVFFPNYESKKVLPSSISGLVNVLRSHHNTPAKKALTTTLNIDPYSIYSLSHEEVVDLIVENIDKVNVAVEHSRSKNVFDNLVNANIGAVKSLTDTTAFKSSYSHLIGEKLDTPEGHLKQIEKGNVVPISMDPF